MAAAILLRRGVLPPIEAAVEEKYVTVRLGYLLPPAEEAFFCLYSWPKNFEIGRSCLFERVFRASVYPFWREMLETLGYCFKEN